MTETMCTFSTPTIEFVDHVARELDYKDRLTAHLTNAATGSKDIICYSLADMVKALFKTQWGGLLQTGSKTTLSWVDLGKLITWLRDVIGDVELADAVERAVDPDECYMNQIKAIEPLFTERLKQYQDVWEARAASDESEAALEASK